MQSKVLVVDDEELVRRAVQRMLASRGYDVLHAENGAQATVRLREGGVHVALIDLHLPDCTGVDLLRRVPRLSPNTECIAFTGHGDVETANSCLENGASDYFEKPIEDWPRFFQVLKRATDVSRLRTENDELKAKEPGDLLGNSASMVQLRERIQRIASSTATVLVRGESGSGKELVARAIHADSGRVGPFVAINCAAIPSALIESELFGYVRGAHSTATGDRAGLFATADEGSILLDEIGDMPLDVQTRLLRVLETRRYRPVGGDIERDTTARVIAASHRDLAALAREGKFREDLLYRLEVLVVDVPPLRDREGDVALLLWRFIKRFNAEEGRQVRRVDPTVLRALEAWRWPGNVRELRNTVQRAVLAADGDLLTQDLLPASVRATASAVPVSDLAEALAPPASSAPTQAFVLDDSLVRPYPDAKEQLLSRFTEHYIRVALAAAAGNVSKAAARAGMHPPNFHRLMRRYGI